MTVRWRVFCRRCGVALTVALGLAGTVPICRAQAPPAVAPETDPGGASGVSAIDEILEADEEVLEGSGYNYDPGTRRDPFKSLLTGQERPEFRGPRPAGIPGLMIDEVSLKGIWRTSKGWTAHVQVSNKEKSYLLQEGDQLYDGDVVSVTANQVIFKQIVNDPTALKPFREVVKKLNP